MTRDEAEAILDTLRNQWVDLETGTVDGRFDAQQLEAIATLMRPEGATGITGSSVPTWQERIAERHPHSEAQYWPDDLKAKYMAYEIIDLRNEVTNLRAQLAAKGQGEPTFWYDASATIEKQRLYDDIWQAPIYLCSHKFGNFTAPLYLTAPASAQPDRGAAQDEAVPKYETVLLAGYHGRINDATVREAMEREIQAHRARANVRRRAA